MNTQELIMDGALQIRAEDNRCILDIDADGDIKCIDVAAIEKCSQDSTDQMVKGLCIAITSVIRACNAGEI